MLPRVYSTHCGVYPTHWKPHTLCGVYPHTLCGVYSTHSVGCTPHTLWGLPHTLTLKTPHTLWGLPHTLCGVYPTQSVGFTPHTLWCLPHTLETPRTLWGLPHTLCGVYPTHSHCPCNLSWSVLALHRHLKTTERVAKHTKGEQNLRKVYIYPLYAC